jgi:uncharacterized protein
MLKLLIIVFAVVAIVWLLKRAFAAPEDGKAQAGPAQTPQGDLVACAHCGVNLPKSEARGGASALFFCSDEHLRLGPRKP